MKHLNDLNKKLKVPNNRENPSNIPTYKDVLVDSLKFSKPRDGSESILLNRLADKIFDADNSIDLEDAEFKILKDKVNENGCQYFTWVHGAVMQSILDWEK